MSGGPSSPSTPQEPGGKPSPSIGDLFWLGTGCAIAIVGGGAIGYAVDTALGTQPWFTFGGLALGVMFAVLLAVTQVRKYL